MRGLTAAVLLFLTLAGAFSNARPTATVTLKVFDEKGEGTPCDFARFKNLSNCAAQKGWDTDCLLQADTYDCLKMQPLRPEGANLAFDCPATCVLSLAWPTASGGYNNLFLDNEGRGWSESATIVFNLQAARDCRRRLVRALATRPRYAASPAFGLSRTQAEEALALAEHAGSDAEQGRLGQKALDLCLQAYDTLLFEYGAQCARERKGKGLQWGFTVDRRAGFSERLAAIHQIVGDSGQGWIRIVCDRANEPSFYRPMIEEARTSGIHVLLQILDSVDNRMPAEKVNERVRAYVDAFAADVDAFEIGNEVNMKAVPGMVERLEYAAAYAREHAPRARTAVVLFWQLGSGFAKSNGAFTFFHWINHNVLPSRVLMENVDEWLVSLYPEGYPLGAPAFDEMMTRLERLFPGRAIGIGETDYWMKGTDRVWAWRTMSDSLDSMRAEFFRWHYAAAAGYEQSVLGGFWWGFCHEMAPSTVLWRAACDLWREMNPGIAGAAPLSGIGFSSPSRPSPATTGP